MIYSESSIIGVKNMKQDKVLEIAKKKMNKEFGSINKAGVYFGVTGQALGGVLRGKQKYIPKYLLDYINFKLDEASYSEIKK